MGGEPTKLILSVREVEITNLLVDGMTNKEIARNLFISPETVKSHISKLLRKLNARNRTEIVSKLTAFRHGRINECPYITNTVSFAVCDKPNLQEKDLGNVYVTKS